MGRPPEPAPEVASTPTQKEAAAKAIQDHIEPDTRTAADWADDETGTVVKSFEGWATSGAVKKAHAAWGEQSQGLMNRLGSEKEALRAARLTLQGTDLSVGLGVRRISPLDQY
ncbi:hypothetical protein ACVNF4_04495 [Streptomyces sp. S6]